VARPAATWPAVRLPPTLCRGRGVEKGGALENPGREGKKGERRKVFDPSYRREMKNSERREKT